MISPRRPVGRRALTGRSAIAFRRALILSSAVIDAPLRRPISRFLSRQGCQIASTVRRGPANRSEGDVDHGFRAKHFALLAAWEDVWRRAFDPAQYSAMTRSSSPMKRLRTGCERSSAGCFRAGPSAISPSRRTGPDVRTLYRGTRIYPREGPAPQWEEIDWQALNTAAQVSNPIKRRWTAVMKGSQHPSTSVRKLEDGPTKAMCAA